MRFGFALLVLITGITHGWSQPSNDFCESATIIPALISDQSFVCISGNNQGALPEIVSNSCNIGIFPTVWFKVSTDAAAAILNIHIASPTVSSPTISIFQFTGNCSTLTPITLTQSHLSCMVGSNGVAEAIGSDVSPNAVYMIAISSYNSAGGPFNLCINSVSSISSSCVKSRDIQITARSNGGPLTGPFVPGETVSICMNVNIVSAASNGCVWFQGLVPQFGNGWDPSSFGPNGQPLNAKINNVDIGVAGNGLYSTSTWDWFTGIGYHHNNSSFQIGDLDGNGTLEVCHGMYNVDCPDFGGITGGCCFFCWANAGDPLPPGWFAYGINGVCAIHGPPPTVDWGDGNNCGSNGITMGPWHFCFDLKVRNFPDCTTDPSTSNLTLGFFTFFDSETGSWGGGQSICARDQPAKLTLPFSCCTLLNDQDLLDTISSGETFTYEMNIPGVEYYAWIANPENVTGAMNGQGPPGTIFLDTLTNLTTSNQLVTYDIQGFDGVCLNYTRQVIVVVLGLPAPVINPPSQKDVIIIDNNSNGLADPSDRITYNVMIENTGAGSANDVQFHAIPDPRTTFLPGSFRSSPLAVPDMYASTMNVVLFIPSGSGVMQNDFDDNIAGLTISTGSFATAMGGTIILFADGSFMYTPPTNFTGTDTSSYTLNDGNGVGVPVPNTDTGLITFNITN